MLGCGQLFLPDDLLRGAVHLEERESLALTEVRGQAAVREGNRYTHGASLLCGVAGAIGPTSRGRNGRRAAAESGTASV